MDLVEVEELVGVEEHLAQVVHGLTEGVCGFDDFGVGAVPSERGTLGLGGCPLDEAVLPVGMVGGGSCPGWSACNDAKGFDAAVPMMGCVSFVETADHDAGGAVGEFGPDG